jgi:hypothetical protein
MQICLSSARRTYIEAAGSTSSNGSNDCLYLHELLREEDRRLMQA